MMHRIGVLVLVLLASACAGEEAGTGPGPEAPSPIVRFVTAEDTDPSLVTINGDHLVMTPAEPSQGLLVFFPGTIVRPERYSTLLSHAADLGFHVIGLGYDNRVSVAIQICRESTDVDCHARARREILFGEESGYSPPDVTPSDSALRRLELLIAHLAETYPDESWGDFLVDGSAADPEVTWSLVTVAGHSLGGGLAGYLATQVPVARVVLFAATEPAPWTTVEPATPVDRWWGLVHADELNVAAVLSSWENLRIPGEPTIVDGVDPPYGDSHRLQTETEECGGEPGALGVPHSCPVVDDYLPQDVDGVLGDAWTQVLTG